MRFLASLSLAFTLAGCASLPSGQTGQTVQVGPSRIAYLQSGKGQPVAVFQSGLGDGKDVWGDVMPRLPPGTAVFAYDRPSYGGSGPLPAQPRDPCAIAHELHAALQAAGQRPPYVLVGHSIGGLYQYAFARLYPSEVAALLLVDPTHPDHWARMQQEAPGPARLLGAARASLFSAAMRSEFDAQASAACAAELQARPAPLMPVRLLVRSDYGLAEKGDFEALMHRLQDHWPVLLPGTTRREVAGTGHYIQKDRPGVVAEELNALIQGASTRQN
ncbi:alpha/beta fold hydrolase [Roseateles sp. NT4]|uniref:alpha/beta fold hydrolase n=1 Tax=Roseateles sp. NT4 TaxID=3453715 RepID=UPI003EE911BC